MKAAVFHHPKKITADNVPDPIIKDSRDIILKVTSTAICGSDLHIYNGFIPQKCPFVMGHEFMGIVEEVGSEVKNLRRGDRVVVPFPISCGQCWFCEHHEPGQCMNSNENYGPEGGLLEEKGGALFGYTDLYGGYNGGQAEYVRVPYGDEGPRKVSDTLSDEQVLFLTDIFPTGYTGVVKAGIKPGDTVAIFGSGPVGLMAQKSAWLMGAGRVIALDYLDYRLDMARRVNNVDTINVTEEKEAIEKIRSMTGGRGADICIDAVGMEAKRSILEKAANIIQGEMGSINALKLCCSAVRRGGKVSILGVYGMPYDNFPLGQIFDKGLQLWCGQAPVHNYIDDLIKHVEEGRIRLDDIITHRMPLSAVADAYQMFANRTDSCVKVVLKP
ncbi:MAG: glutathione-dependent formaldehyde dehydrogenase [Bacteroidetes bacterium]|nr:glutathione-dependent formaldehyde dehydrogenase [Bacteroidota bacterium]